MRMADEAEKPGEGYNSKKIDFVAAAKILKTEVAPISDKLSKSRGDMSAVKKRLEDLGVNKRGANFVQGLLSASPATASDILRTVVGLLEPCGLGVFRDMVDVAEGKSSLEIPLIDTPSVDV